MEIQWTLCFSQKFLIPVKAKIKAGEKISNPKEGLKSQRKRDLRGNMKKSDPALSNSKGFFVK